MSRVGPICPSEREVDAIQQRTIAAAKPVELDFYAYCHPQNGSLGGDRIDIIEYSERFRHEKFIRSAKDRGAEHLIARLERTRGLIGVLLTDTSGHGILSDVVVPGELHGAAYNGIGYELERNGHVSVDLFERMNNQHYNRYPTHTTGKFTTMMYGEVSKKDGSGKFISAGHPFPLILRANGTLEKPLESWSPSSPLGVYPSRGGIYKVHADEADFKQDKYVVNEFTMGKGDTVLFFSDWLTEHGQAHGAPKLYTATPRFREILAKLAAEPVKALVEGIIEDAMTYTPVMDDVTLCGIRRL